MDADEFRELCDGLAELAEQMKVDSVIRYLERQEDDARAEKVYRLIDETCRAIRGES